MKSMQLDIQPRMKGGPEPTTTEQNTYRDRRRQSRGHRCSLVACPNRDWRSNLGPSWVSSGKAKRCDQWRSTNKRRFKEIQYQHVLNTFFADRMILGKLLEDFPGLRVARCRWWGSPIDQACLGAATVRNIHHLAPPGVPFH